MARTPVPGSNETRVTAFLVTPDMPGFEVVEARMPKCGIRGTATARLAFHDMPVPAENILGPLGKGLRVALTVLDFGRTTFGASCTGAAKTCIEAAVRHARTRVQFKEPIGEFELTKKKIAYMAAHAFAMEAMTAECAGFIDRGADDYMLETAMLKVFTTDASLDDRQRHAADLRRPGLLHQRAVRTHGCATPASTMIGEGANEVLKAFIAVVGMRGVGEALRGVLGGDEESAQGVLDAVGVQPQPARGPLQDAGGAGAVAGADRRRRRVLSALVRDFGIVIPKVLAHLRSKALARGSYDDEEIAILDAVLKSQYIHERLANAACDLYASSCSLARLDRMLAGGNGSAPAHRDIEAGKHFLAIAERRVRQNLAELWDNLDDETTRVADLYLKGDAT